MQKRRLKLIGCLCFAQLLGSRAIRQAMNTLVRRAILAVALGLFCLSWLSWLTPLHWAFDLASHFRVQYATAGSALALCALALRAYPAALLSAFVAAYNCALVMPLFVTPQVGAAAGPSFSVLSYNTWRRNDDWLGVQGTIHRFDPDVALLLETTPQVQSGTTDLVGYHRYERGDQILLVARGRSIEAKNFSSLSPRVRGGFAADLSIEGHPLRLLGVHLAPPTSASYAEARRMAGVEIAKDAAGRREPVVLIGDLNATPWSHSFGALLQTTSLVSSQRGFGIQPTWPLRPRVLALFAIPIDHCLHSRSVRTVERVVGDPENSDHPPLVLRLQLRRSHGDST
jgi:endonuclease/exonuclease/phosphatase (EEP) superfamily protein YafD